MDELERMLELELNSSSSQTSSKEILTLSETDKIFIISNLYCSWYFHDTETRDAVILFCAHNLSDQQFRKIYKSCIKFIKRLGGSEKVKSFDLFLKQINTESEEL